MAVLTIRVLWQHQDGGELPFLKLSVRVGGSFSWPENAVEEDYVAGWLKFNGTYLLWPYARTYIANLVTLSGMPPLHIMTIMIPRPSLGETTTDFEAVEVDQSVE